MPRRLTQGTDLGLPSTCVLAQVAARRYTVKQCIKEAKGETGLDDYQVRHWQSWHRHITLSMMAHTWLAAIRYRANQEKGARSLSSLY